MQPKLSVILIHYNQKLNLSTSLKAIFNQDMPHEDYEVIVADDGTPGGIDDVIQAYAGMNLKSVTNPRSGAEINVFRNPATIRNLGLKAARGHIVVMHAAELVPCSNDVLARHCAHHNLPRLVHGLLTDVNEAASSAIVSGSMPPSSAFNLPRAPTHRAYYGSRSFKLIDAERVRGFSSCYKGWGAEDNDFDMRLVRCGITDVVDNEIHYIHLFHKSGRSQVDAIKNAIRFQYMEASPGYLAVHNNIDKDAFRLYGDIIIGQDWGMRAQPCDLHAMKFTGTLIIRPNFSPGSVASFVDDDFNEVYSLMVDATKQISIGTSALPLQDENSVDLTITDGAACLIVNGSMSDTYKLPVWQQVAFMTISGSVYVARTSAVAQDVEWKFIQLS